MSSAATEAEAAQPGWRERKRRQTHRRVWETALELFAEHGFEATTLDAIAEGAGISKRTFFHYFASKEDVLAAWQADVPGMFHDAVLSAAGDTPIEVIRTVFAMAPPPLDTAQTVAIGRIIAANDQLRASNLAKLLKLEEALVAAFSKRWPDRELAGLRALAMLATGALRLGVDRFVEEEGRRPVALFVQEALADLSRELSGG